MSLTSGSFTVRNAFGEALSAVIDEPSGENVPRDDAFEAGTSASQRGLAPVVILCHGFRNTKESAIVVNLSRALLAASRAVVRFDFAGNGASEGVWGFGNYSHEVEDLRAVVQHMRRLGRDVVALVGHSKAGSVVLLYGAQYNDVRCIVNVAGRFHMAAGIEERLGAEGMAALAADGVWLQRDRLGPYAVTKESVEERRRTDMTVAKGIQAAVLTVHGTADEVIPWEDALAYDALGMPSHEVELVDGADHMFRGLEERRQMEMAVVQFVRRHATWSEAFQNDCTIA